MNKECTDLCLESKEALNKSIAQHRTTNSSRQDSAVYLYLKDKGHRHIHIPDREDKWLESGMKEVIYVKMENPLRKGGDGLQHQYNDELLPLV